MHISDGMVFSVVLVAGLVIWWGYRMVTGRNNPDGSGGDGGVGFDFDASGDGGDGGGGGGGDGGGD